MKQFFRTTYKWNAVYYHFQKWSKDGSWEKAWQALLQKHNGLLNMSSIQLDGSHTAAKCGAKSNSYNQENDIGIMANKNIIVLCKKNNLKTVKNVLYQIRCNIFHGEKNPSVRNGDQIVKSALPLLNHIVEFLLAKHKIKKNATYLRYLASFVRYLASFVSRLKRSGW